MHWHDEEKFDGDHYWGNSDSTLDPWEIFLGNSFVSCEF